MITQPERSDLIPFYAAVSAVQDGKVGEVEIEYRTVESEGREEFFTITVRSGTVPASTAPA